MTWQDELQKLDAELASGRISADDYRRRRDEVLAGSASAPQQPQPQQQGPFAPPFRWDSAPPQQGAPNPDATQVVTPQQQAPQPPSNPDATQVVTGGARGDADRTQFVRPVQQPQQQGGWQSQPPIGAPPWGQDGGFGPVSDPTPGWIAQGPEVFDESKSGGKGKIFAIIGVVLVIALIGGGVWWFMSGEKKDPNPPTAGSTTQTPTSTTPSGPKLPAGDLKGRPDEKNSGKTTVQEASGQRSQFSPAEAELMTTCGAEDGLAQVHYSDTWFAQIHVFTCKDETAAKTAVEGLMAQQKTYGYKEGVGPNSIPAMISEVAADVPTLPFDERIFYASKSTLVRIQVRGKDRASMDSGAQTVLTAVDKSYPTK